MNPGAMLFYLGAIVLGAVMFGFWQQSFYAGIWMACVLNFAAAIAYNLENRTG